MVKKWCNLLRLAEFNRVMIEPLAKNQWNASLAAHLLNRAGFGGDPAEIQRLADLGFEAAVASLVDVDPKAGKMVTPDWADSSTVAAARAEVRQADKEERRALRKKMRQQERRQLMELRSAWLEQMQQGADPLREKMTLFWHGHFATSTQKVKASFFIWRQNDLLRQQALGDFGMLVRGVARDPAMMRYLDLQQSKAKKPNENFARELMELFTLGEGYYSEEDIQESARAFTGYRINPRTLEFVLRQRQHDAGDKQFMGQTGTFDGDKIVTIILQQPQCGRFIVRKLWEFFAYESPAESLVDALAEGFRSSGYNIRGLMRNILRSREFYSQQSVSQQIKSPVQWLVQAANELEIPVPSGKIAQRALSQLGQTLIAPPNVKGWDGGKAWISSASLLYRYNLAAALLRADGSRAGNNQKTKKRRRGKLAAQVAMERIASAALRENRDALIDSLIWRLFQQEVPAEERRAFVDFFSGWHEEVNDEAVRGLVHLMMSTPRYQLC